MAHPMTRTGGLFEEFYDDVVGVDIDFDRFEPASFDDELVEEARARWHQRAHTEFRSVQVMTRFMTETTGAGDPIDVYAAGVDLIEDEVRHTALCMEMCRALGFDPVFPEPIRPDEPQQFLEAEMGERATHTALSMVAINEAISYGFITDLAARCEEPTVAGVLDATIADEEGHQDLGWVYLEKSFRRFPDGTRSQWRELVRQTLEPHLRQTNRVLEELDGSERHLEAWPDDARIELGLHSTARHALVFRDTYYEVVKPRLEELDLMPDGLDEPVR